MLSKILKQKNICCGWLYFYVHFITEVVCFFTLTRLLGQTADNAVLWFLPLFYDMLAFVPQSVIGHIADSFPKVCIGLIGTGLITISSVIFELSLFSGPYVPIGILCIGNCCIHVSGAELTLRCSDGKLSHSAIFVSGGSFGVISGKLLAGLTRSYIPVAIAALTMIPFILLAEEYKKSSDADNTDFCSSFRYASDKIPAAGTILISVFVVIARGYMGYGIPSSWSKTMLHTVILFCSMGTGKALGGILSDAFGMRKVALFSLTAALPFLLAGDEHMFISITGVMLFSMTMSVTLGILVSVLPKAPGLAFGLTTIGLFLGTAPVFFITPANFQAECVTLCILTILCIAGLAVTIRRDM